MFADLSQRFECKSGLDPQTALQNLITMVKEHKEKKLEEDII